ncbi:hypothetical protein BDK51DRAFT_36997 [Blyttiomyces helicus]|uniref:Uncharacterized protein n=1 Tax=Blyttiomyces helicus TaxID=388810 RepID=A0A4P9VZ13_9FUNG|nr:hypothetical protein BDK51DRAFT_36997 [Blyttiomyces helicus]|eukprot:RKO84013.1 hypothetical protein BDK51DRAFT_36997 [Blyttiomyces helicus]
MLLSYITLGTLTAASAQSTCETTAPPKCALKCEPVTANKDAVTIDVSNAEKSIATLQELAGTAFVSIMTSSAPASTASVATTSSSVQLAPTHNFAILSPDASAPTAAAAGRTSGSPAYTNIGLVLDAGGAGAL